MFDTQMAHDNQLLSLPSRQETGSKRVLNELIETQQKCPHFQPVIDLMTASALGF